MRDSVWRKRDEEVCHSAGLREPSRAELSWVLCINYKPIIGESRSANPAIGNSRDRVGGTIEAVQNNVLNVLRAKLC